MLIEMEQIVSLNSEDANAHFHKGFVRLLASGVMRRHWQPMIRLFVINSKYANAHYIKV